jgi:hypothetical protein
MLNSIFSNSTKYSSIREQLFYPCVVLSLAIVLYLIPKSPTERPNMNKIVPQVQLNC